MKKESMKGIYISIGVIIAIFTLLAVGKLVYEKIIHEKLDQIQYTGDENIINMESEIW